MKSKFIKLLIAITAVVMLLWLLDESTGDDSAESSVINVPTVSTIAVKPKAESSNIVVTGMVKPRWQVEVIANVRGQVTESYQQIVPGSFVKEGQTLAQINDIEYRAALANAKANLASAKLELARIVNEQSVAKTIDKGEASNDFRQYKPHVAAAKSSLAAAQAQVKAVQKELADTKIKAPFDAIVLAKHIVPSQQINQGDSVYSLASSKAIDIEVSLSNKQWQKITTNSEETENIQAQISDFATGTWQANTRYLAPMLNSQTRQRSLVLTIAEPYQQQLPLMPEQQVQATFAINNTTNAVLAPATVLTRDNKVWTVQGNELALESINLIEERANQIMFVFQRQPSKQRQLVLYPLSTMLVGQAVEPVIAEQGE